MFCKDMAEKSKLGFWGKIGLETDHLTVTELCNQTTNITTALVKLGICIKYHNACPLRRESFRVLRPQTCSFLGEFTSDETTWVKMKKSDPCWSFWYHPLFSH